MTDAAAWLGDLADECFSGAVKTLDPQHAREHLRVVADAEHGAGTAEARAWMKLRLAYLQGGREARVLSRWEERPNPDRTRSPESLATVTREAGAAHLLGLCVIT